MFIIKIILLLLLFLNSAYSLVGGNYFTPFRNSSAFPLVGWVDASSLAGIQNGPVTFTNSSLFVYDKNYTGASSTIDHSPLCPGCWLGIGASTGTALSGNTITWNAGTRPLYGLVMTNSLTSDETITGTNLYTPSDSENLYIYQDNVTYPLTIDMPIVGTKGIIKQGAGTLILTGESTYAGNTWVDTGTLQVGVGGTAGSLPSSSVPVVASGAKIKWDKSTAYTIVAWDQNGSLEFKTGAGLTQNAVTVKSLQSVTYTPATSLTIGGAAIIDAATLSITGTSMVLNATLTASHTNNWTYSPVISGTGGLTKEGTGALTLSGQNTFSGTKTINNGNLIIDITGRTDGSSANLGTFVINAGGKLTFYNTNTSVDNYLLNSLNSITGTGTLEKTGAGFFTLWTSTNTIKNFAGQINVQAGTLCHNDAGWQTSAGAMDMYIAAGAKFDMRVGDVIMDTLTGSGSIIKTYTPNLSLYLGTNNGTGTWAGSIAQTGNGGSGTITVRKQGTGTQTFSATNSYTGGTVITNGTLVCGVAGALGTGTVTVTAPGIYKKNSCTNATTGTGTVTP